MSKIKKFAWAEYLLITFYIGLFATPSIIHDGYDLSRTISLLLKTMPANYLLYIIPVAAYVFFKKIDIPGQEKTALSIFLYFFLYLSFYIEFSSSSSNYFYAAIAILVFSVILININSLTASLILLPGLFVKQLGLVYIFTAYIPVLFLMMIKTSASQTESDEKSEKKLSFALLFAYLYASVLTTILLLKHKIPLSIESTTPYLALADDYINLTAGIILLFAACVLFIIRAFPVIRNGGITEKTAIIFAAVYPLFFAGLCSFYTLISYNFKSAFTLALLMYVMNNIQLGISYKKNVGGVIPEKLNNSAGVITAAVLLCSFCFN